MFKMRRIAFLLVGGALVALPWTAAAQTVPADRLIEKYTTLAGSGENAASLVTGLRDGTEIQLSPPPGAGGTGATFSPPTGMMGFGNVNIALALTEAQLANVANPAPADIQNALMNADNGILTLRDQGMGWGEIAHALGFKLGDLMRSSAAGDAQAAGTRGAPAQRLARESGIRGRSESARSDRLDRPEKPERVERFERGGGRPERVGR